MRTLVTSLAALAIALLACHPQPSASAPLDAGDAGQCAAACAVIPSSCPESGPLCLSTCIDLEQSGIGGFSTACVLSHPNDAATLAADCNVCH